MEEKDTERYLKTTMKLTKYPKNIVRQKIILFHFMQNVQDELNSFKSWWYWWYKSLFHNFKWLSDLNEVYIKKLYLTKLHLMKKV